MIDNKLLNDLAVRQKQLDDYIYEKKQIKFNNHIRDKKLIAFFVEIAEFVNEERGFKFWSQKPPSARDILLEEYIDGLHFILSIGLELDYDFASFKPDYNKVDKPVENKYFDLISCYSKYVGEKNQPNYTEMLAAFLAIACHFDFSEAEILEAYQKKNQTNFNRQEQNY